jgi:hypothetical protein
MLLGLSTSEHEIPLLSYTKKKIGYKSLTTATAMAKVPLNGKSVKMSNK